MGIKKQVSLNFFLVLSLCLGGWLGGIGDRAWAVEEDSFSSHSTVQLISFFRSLSVNTRIVPIGIQVHLDPGWHSYWKYPGDIGKPLTVDWKLPDRVKASSLYWPSPKKIVTDRWTSFIYDRSFLLVSYLSVENFNLSHLEIGADIKWFICKEVCIPLKKTVSLSIPITNQEDIHPSHKNTFDKWFKQNPSANNPSVNNLSAKNFNSPRGVLSKVQSLINYRLIWIFLLAFFGGLLLNFMPCVLPIVFLKFYNTFNQNNYIRSNMIGTNIFYSLGVIVSFWVLAGLLVFLKKGGAWIGWGFQMQSVNFLISLAFLFTLVGLNFMGWFSVSLVSSNRSFFGVTKFNSSFLNSFLTGILSAVFASPCTAPFMGAVIGYAFSQTGWDIFFVFSFLGLGLSSPYLLLSVFPSCLRLVPSPGRWSEILKKWMTFPMLGSTAWIVGLISHQKPDLVFPLLLSFVLLFMGFWLKNYLKRGRLIAWWIIMVSIFYPFFVWNRAEIKSLKWDNFSISLMEQKQKEGKSLLVNFTASWCLTCQFNEQWTFKNQKVIRWIKEQKIYLLKGDWTDKNPEITKILNQYGRAGIPFYLYLPNGAKKGIILPELLTPSVFLKWVQQQDTL